MTHVQQYLDEMRGNSALDCIDAEVEAFIAQDDFFSFMTLEEIKSINGRLETDDFLHPQLQVLKTMRGVSQEYVLPACGFLQPDCSREVMRVRIKPTIKENPYYKEQCNLRRS